MSSLPPPQENSYIIDIESGAEMARLIEQDRLFTRHMGGLFPPDLDLSTVESVLDIACGPGGWVQEVAFHHPQIEVTGIDISQKMLRYARALTQAQGLDNATFEIMDATSPLDFADHSFDFVNARFLVGFLPRAVWPRLVQECVRLTRPGGTIRLTELDNFGSTTSDAFETINRLGAQAYFQTGKGLSTDGRDLGMTVRLHYLLKAAGCQQLREQSHVINFSADTPAYQSTRENWKLAAILSEPFLVKTGITTSEAWRQLIAQAEFDMLASDFSGLQYYLSAWGKKP
jgi:SAM-dependent methyltransferase